MHTSTTMSMFTFILLAEMAASNLLISRPKLKSQSPKNVWFHMPDADEPENLTLICQGTGVSDKYEWFKNGHAFVVDGSHVIWDRAGLSGDITFIQPTVNDVGYYQCSVSNSHGVAMSNVFHVQVGVLHYFNTHPVKNVHVEVGQPLTLRCSKPYGFPAPTVFWFYRDMKSKNAIDSVHTKHITVDGDGNLQFAHIEPRDASANLIYQCGATSPVLHGGFRAGDQYRLLLKRTHTSGGKQPTPIRLLWKTPLKIHTTTSSNLKLRCIFSGRPLPKVEWTKKGTKLDYNRVSKRHQGKTLLIYNVTEADQGTYTCSANGYLPYEIFVNVSSVPQWIYGPPTDISVVENSKAKLHCQVRGVPRPVIRWYKNGVRMNDFSLQSRRLVSASGETLILLNVQHHLDIGVYQCNASNAFGYVFANVFIEVLAYAPRFVNTNNETVDAMVGDNVRLDCNAEAAPKAKIKWTQHGKNIQDSWLLNNNRLKLLQNNSLLVERVTVQQAGVYVCTAVNKYGAVQMKTKLNVYAPNRVGYDPSGVSEIRDLVISSICVTLTVSGVLTALMWRTLRNRVGIYPVRIMQALREHRNIDEKMTLMEECRSDTHSNAESL